MILYLTLISCNQKKDKNEPIEENYSIKYNNGNTYCKGTYLVYGDDDKTKIGEWFYYFPNGNIQKITEFSEYDVESYKVYNERNNLSKTFLKTEISEIYSYYFENGNLESESIDSTNDYEDDSENVSEKSIEKKYYSNGQLREIRQFKNDIPEGNFKIWDSVGVLMLDVKYINGEIIEK